MRFGRTLFAVVLSMAALLVAGFATSAVAQEAEQAPVEPVTLPARVEAEAFDTGGEGVAYHEEDVDFAGDLRLDEGVDVYRKRVRGGYSELIGRTRNGEWVEYTVTAAEADQFEFKVVLASGAPDPGTVTVSVDGVDVGTASGATDGWYNWTARSAGLATLDAGEHVVRLTWADGGNVNVDAIEIVSTTPTCETGLVEAESATISGRFTEFLDNAASGDRYLGVPKGAGGWWRGASNDYVEFCVGVESGGEYVIDALVKAPSNRDNSFYVSVDGGPLVEFVADVTGRYDIRWDAVNDAGLNDPLPTKFTPPSTRIVDPVPWELTPGDHTVRFYLRRDGAGIDAIELNLADRGFPGECGASDADCAALFALSPEFFRNGDPCRAWATCENGRITEISLLGGSGEPAPIIISSIPAEIGNLTGLRRLYIQDATVTELPPEIGNLVNLEVLSVAAAQLTELPPEIGNLTNVETLLLSAGQLTELPAEIGNLTNLDTLTLFRNELTELPPEIGNLPRLQRLSLSNNPLVSLPPEIGNLTSLLELSVSDAELASLPPEIGNLANLTRLSVNRNPLTSLPVEIGDLTALVTLWIDQTPISELPAEIGNLVNLRDLRMVVMPELSTLPDEFVNLTNLERFSLFNTCVTVENVDVRAMLDRLDPDWEDCGEPPPPPPAACETFARLNTGVDFPTSPTVGDDGQIYFTDLSNSLWVHDPATGVSTGFGLATATAPSVASDGVVYFWRSSGVQFDPLELTAFDPDTGEAAGLGIFERDVAGKPPVAEGADGTIYTFATGADGSAFALWAYNPATRSASEVETVAQADAVWADPVVAANGLLYLVEDNGVEAELWVYDPVLDSLSELGVDASVNGRIYDLAVGPLGRVYFIADTDVAESALWRYRPASGSVSPIASVGSGSGGTVRQPNVGPDGLLWFLASADRLFVYDPVTNAIVDTQLASVAEGLTELAVGPDGTAYVTAYDADARANDLWAYEVCPQP